MRFLLPLVFCFLVSAAAAQSGGAIVEQIGPEAILVAEGSVATVTQDGTDNRMALEQTGGSLAEIVQRGSGNVLAGFDTLGFSDEALAALSLDGSTLYLLQDGTGNKAFVQQADGAYASITQIGMNNTATIIQSGGVVILP